MIEIFQYDFMTRAFIAGTIIAVLAPVVGIFLVVRRYSLMADTLAHVTFLGVAIGTLINVNPFYSAIILTIFASLGVEKLQDSQKIAGESVLAIFLSGSLALAIVLFSLTHGLGVNIQSYLFGSITTITQNDLYIILGFTLIVLGLLSFFYRHLFLASYDTELAKINGVPVGFVNKLLVILAAITVSLSIRIVGVLLIGALMVIPVVTALLYNLGFRKTIYLSIIFSLLSVISGLFLSFFLNLASGGTIVVVSLVVFVVSLMIRNNR
jgi:zinc transport system permease protein